MMINSNPVLTTGEAAIKLVISRPRVQDRLLSAARPQDPDLLDDLIGAFGQPGKILPAGPTGAVIIPG